MNPPSPELVREAKSWVNTLTLKDRGITFEKAFLAGARAGIEMAAKLFEIPPGEENNLTTDADAQWKIRALLETK